MTWTIKEYTESLLEKARQIYTEGENLVIRSDLDHQGFGIPRGDLPAVLDGEARPVCLLESSEEAGTGRLSPSGRAMNFSIGPFFYTTPVQSVLRILAGEQLNAPPVRQDAEGGRGLLDQSPNDKLF